MGGATTTPLSSLYVYWDPTGDKGLPGGGAWGSDIGQTADDRPGPVVGNAFARCRCC